MNHKLNLKWASHLKDEKDREKLEQAILNSQVALRRLLEIVNQEEQSVKPKTDDYDCPSWAFKQAHINGKLEAFRQIKALLSHLEG